MNYQATDKARSSFCGNVGPDVTKNDIAARLGS
jgi:hypothetical protein